MIFSFFSETEAASFSSLRRWALVFSLGGAEEEEEEGEYGEEEEVDGEEDEEVEEEVEEDGVVGVGTEETTTVEAD